MWKWEVDCGYVVEEDISVSIDFWLVKRQDQHVSQVAVVHHAKKQGNEAPEPNQDVS